MLQTDLRNGGCVYRYVYGDCTGGAITCECYGVALLLRMSKGVGVLEPLCAGTGTVMALGVLSHRWHSVQGWRLVCLVKTGSLE